MESSLNPQTELFPFETKRNKLGGIHSSEGDQGPSCSKLMTWLVNVWLKFQMLISQICQYFLLKKCEKLLSFFQQKISVYLVIKCKTLNELTS